MARFNTTQWSVVLEAQGSGDGARTALESLCRTYRTPVLAYIRGRGHGGEEADDLTQAFFATLLDPAHHIGADPARGRFRAYLLAAIRNFLINAAERDGRVKRGGRVEFESLDASDGELQIAGGETPEQAFDRSWAAAVLDAALRSLRREARAAGKLPLFEQLSGFLIEAPDEEDYARVAAALGMRRYTIAVSVHRLRQRLRALVHAEVAQTTAGAGDLAEEMRDLRDAFGRTMRPDQEGGASAGGRL
jgi:RNA polymerase sigma-70 factor (ECF subfamily)